MKKAFAWEIEPAGGPKSLPLAAIDLEKHLEDWIDADPNIIGDDVLLIGRQVATVYGTKLDLLAINRQGDLVIIELKRDQTLRETVAQGIEYAAWVSKLGFDDIMKYAVERYAGEAAFRQAFEERFNSPLPDTINSGQKILLVAPEITDATASVIEYLAGAYRVPINAVSFDLFAVDSRRVLVRHFVLEESQTPQPPGSKQGNRARARSSLL
jgi:hypothetical protein